MQKFLDKNADADLELDLASGSLTGDTPTGRGGAKRIKKSASESVLMKNGDPRDSPLSSILSERSAEINYDWVRCNLLLAFVGRFYFLSFLSIYRI